MCKSLVDILSFLTPSATNDGCPRCLLSPTQFIPSSPSLAPPLFLPCPYLAVSISVRSVFDWCSIGYRSAQGRNLPKSTTDRNPIIDPC